MTPLRLLLVSLVSLALLPATAAAAETIAVEDTPFTADSYGGVVVWSFRRSDHLYRLRARRNGVVSDLPVAPSPVPFDDVDMGPARDGSPTAVYSRCSITRIGDRDCDIERFDFATGRASIVAGVSSTRHSEYNPSIFRGRIAFTRPVRTRRGARNNITSGIFVGYTNGRRRPVRQPGGPVTPGGAPAMAIELGYRGLFYVWATTRGNCCARQTLYWVRGDRRRRVDRVSHGMLSDARILAPSVDDHYVYYARVHVGGGGPSRFMRYSLRTGRRHATPGTSRARSLTWLGGRRFLLATAPEEVEEAGCRGHGAAPTAPSQCRLEITDPVSWRRVK